MVKRGIIKPLPDDGDSSAVAAPLPDGKRRRAKGTSAGRSGRTSSSSTVGGYRFTNFGDDVVCMDCGVSFEEAPIFLQVFTQLV